MFIHSQESEPLVSVVIACYNYGVYLEEAIDSCLASTIQNIEIIVVDDGSTDPYTVELFRTMKKPKTKVIRQENKGIPAALNRGIREARGKYIFRLDADDRIHHTLLEKGALVLDTRPHVGFVTCYLQAFDQENWTWILPPFSLAQLLRDNIVVGNSMFRRAAWEGSGGFDEQGKGYEDWDFWIQLTSLGWGGFCIPELLFFYRRHGETESVRQFPRQNELREHLRRKHHRAYSMLDAGQLEYSMRQSSAISANWNIQSDNYMVTKPADDKIKIMIIMPWLIIGGAETFFLDLLEAMPRDQYHITLVTTIREESPLYQRYDQCTDEIFLLPSICELPEQMEAIIHYLIETRGIQILHNNNSEVGYNILPGLKARFPHLKTIALLHAYVPELPWDHVRHSVQFDPWIDCYNVCRQSMKDTLTSLFHINPEKICLLPNGINTNLYRPGTAEEYAILKQGFNIPLDKKVVSYIARLNIDKDPLKFISIAKQMIAADSADRYRFLIVGEGPLKQQVIEAIGPLSSKIIVLGARGDVHQILKFTDVMASTSPSEGLPISGLEAMAAGVPVIAFAVRGWMDLIHQHHDGVLIGRSEAEELDYAQQLMYLLDHSEWRERMSAAARQKIETYYGREAFLNRYQALYRLLVSGIIPH
ncbi:glycosyltransferase [Paenibacillus lactis]|uniref:glycosyltransferase n=1 Tax=Paenibacillus lactis TaxID=228574 RepID=UPI001B246886|nr:glycosyltransferase [Paenibacillus lactis]GIO93513.1 hypothetical protein J31TS3_47400 [Paenibacillus lactis]